MRAGTHVTEDHPIADGINVALDANGNELSRNAIFGHADQALFVSTLENRLERNRCRSTGPV